MFAYHLAPEVADGRLRIVLAGDEHAPLPVHLVSPHGRLAGPKVRAFVDFALPQLREAFERRRLASDSAGSRHALNGHRAGASSGTVDRFAEECSPNGGYSNATCARLD